MMGVANARGMSGAMWYPAEQLAMQGSLSSPLLSAPLLSPLLVPRYRTAARASSAGVVSIVCHNSPPYVAAAPGSARRVFGTNPMAFGWPRAGGLPPYVWDQASSVMARGEIEVHQRDGRPLPPGEVWGRRARPAAG